MSIREVWVVQYLAYILGVWICEVEVWSYIGLGFGKMAVVC